MTTMTDEELAEALDEIIMLFGKQCGIPPAQLTRVVGLTFHTMTVALDEFQRRNERN